MTGCLANTPLTKGRKWADLESSIESKRVSIIQSCLLFLDMCITDRFYSIVVDGLADLTLIIQTNNENNKKRMH